MLIISDGVETVALSLLMLFWCPQRSQWHSSIIDKICFIWGTGSLTVISNLRLLWVQTPGILVQTQAILTWCVYTLSYYFVTMHRKILFHSQESDTMILSKCTFAYWVGITISAKCVNC